MEGGGFPSGLPPPADAGRGRGLAWRRWLGLGGVWVLAALVAVAAFLLLEMAAPAIGLAARLALAALPLAAAPWILAVIFPPARPDARPEPRGLASLPPTGAGPRPGRAPAARPDRPPAIAPSGAPSAAAPPVPVDAAPAVLVTHLLRDAAARPASEAERRELAVRRQHDRAFAAALRGLDETGGRALLAARRHPSLAADLADTARRIEAARRVQAPLPPDPGRDALHAALLAAAPAVAAEFLEVMRIAPDLDPAQVATDLMRQAAQPAGDADAARAAPAMDERRLTAALAALTRLGPVSARTNRDGSITLRPAPAVEPPRRLPGA